MTVEDEQALPEIDEESVRALPLKVPPFPSTAQYKIDPVQTRKEYALLFKNAGNKTYTARKFNEAIDLYTKAIMCHADPVFYSNRAACPPPHFPLTPQNTKILTCRLRSTKTTRQNHRRRLRRPGPQPGLLQSPPPPRPRLRRNLSRPTRPQRLDRRLHPRRIQIPRRHKQCPTCPETSRRDKSSRHPRKQES